VNATIPERRAVLNRAKRLEEEADEVT